MRLVDHQQVHMPELASFLCDRLDARECDLPHLPAAKPRRIDASGRAGPHAQQGLVILGDQLLYMRSQNDARAGIVRHGTLNE